MLILFVLHQLLLFFRSIDNGEQPGKQQDGDKDDTNKYQGGNGETGDQNK